MKIERHVQSSILLLYYVFVGEGCYYTEKCYKCVRLQQVFAIYVKRDHIFM